MGSLHRRWLEFYGQANFLKGGIIYADTLSTVSPRYAQEIQTPELGAGLEGVLQKRSADLKGILNGVDYDEWNPATDGKIAAHYTPERMQGKRDCRRDLMHAFGLKSGDDTPVLGIISWLSSQKGFDLLAEIMPELMTSRPGAGGAGHGRAVLRRALPLAGGEVSRAASR